METSITISIPGSGSGPEHVHLAATDAERKHRKKVLNRMNQRARSRWQPGLREDHRYSVIMAC